MSDNSNLPKIGAPAMRALFGAGINNLKQLEKWSIKELRELHGMGPKALGILQMAMRKRNLSFAKREQKSSVSKKYNV